MIKVTDKKVEPVDAHPPETLLDYLHLDFDMRQRGRFKTVSELGVSVGVVLSERGKVLSDGQLLTSDCGKTFIVKAQTESLVCATTDDWLRFSQACYHLGNRHVPLQIGERALYFKPDHVLEEMVRSLGLVTNHCEAMFNPESGAYSHSAHHGHDHSHA